MSAMRLSWQAVLAIVLMIVAAFGLPVAEAPVASPG